MGLASHQDARPPAGGALVVGAGGQYPVGGGGRQPGRSQPPSQATGPVAADACGASDSGQWDEGATGTRTELCDAWTLVPHRRRLAGGGVAASSSVAGGVARALSCRPLVAAGNAAEATETAGTPAGETTQTQGGPSCGQGQREKGGLKTYPCKHPRTPGKGLRPLHL